MVVCRLFIALGLKRQHKRKINKENFALQKTVVRPAFASVTLPSPPLHAWRHPAPRAPCGQLRQPLCPRAAFLAAARLGSACPGPSGGALRLGAGRGQHCPQHCRGPGGAGSGGRRQGEARPGTARVDGGRPRAGRRP